MSIPGRGVRDLGETVAHQGRELLQEAKHMGAMRVHEFMSLDGVISEPTFTFEYGFEPAMGEAIAGAIDSSSGILLGRTTYQMFEPAWSTRTAEEDPGAPFFNDTMKYVVSSTLEKATWRNSEIVGGYDPAVIRRLKDEASGGLYVSGSGTLVRAMMGDGLVDELHLFVYPVVLGTGPRLFGEGTSGKWTLASSQAYGNGVLYVRYHLAA
jgi:dihydrofolate reductase